MSQLNHRIQRISPMCTRCGIENESDHHLLFTCPVSRAAWFISPLALKTEELTMDLALLVTQMRQNLPEQQFSFFLNLMWIIWKSRNAKIFNGDSESPQKMIAQAQALTTVQFQVREGQRPSMVQQQPAMPNSYLCYCYCDGSWDSNGRAGIGLVFTCDRGAVQHMHCRAVNASSPFHAEVLALLEAMKLITALGYPQRTLFCTDVIDLKNFCESALEEHIADWRATEDVYQMRSLLQDLQGAGVVYMPRKFLLLPHMLANYARRSGQQFMGIPSQQMMEQMQLGQELHFFVF